MTTYLISYDEHDADDYDDLYEAIKSYPKWSKGLESVWFIVSDDSAVDIRDNLEKHLNKEAKLLVTKMTVPWASRNLGKKRTDWLKANT